MGRQRPFGSIDQTRVTTLGRTLHLPSKTNQPPQLPVAGYTCSMSFPGSRYDFDPDPTQVAWTLNANINLLPTRGGQMAYSAGRTIGPLLISGYLRSKWDLFDLSDFVKEHMKDAQLNGNPARFVYPDRDFDFSIFIQNMDEIGLNGEEGEITQYTLTCVVTHDHTSLKKIKPSQLIPGIPKNIEWIDVENAAKIAEQRFGEGFTNAGEQSGQDGSEETSPDEEDVTKPNRNSGGRTPSGTGPGGRKSIRDSGDNNIPTNTPQNPNISGRPDWY